MENLQRSMTVIYPVPEMLPDPRARFIQIMNTCSALAEAGVKVILLSGIYRKYSNDDILAFYGIRRHANLKIIRLPMLRRENAKFLRFSWHGIFHLSLLLYLFIKKQKEKNTVLFIRHIKLADFLLKFKKLLNIPIMFEIHEIFYLNTLNKKKREGLRQQEMRVYKNADAVVCISQSLRQYLVDSAGICGKSVFVVPHGVKREWFDIKKGEQGLYICYTGSLHAWKGVDTLISAIKCLDGEKLMIVGGGSRFEELKKFAKEKGVAERVDFAGNVPHKSIPEYLSKAKVVVLPNIAEGPSELSSPLKLFEYMTSGAPIVASDIASFREILTHRQNAVLFSTGNPESLAMRIKEVCDNPELAARIAEQARKDVAGYTYEKRAEGICTILNGLEIGISKIKGHPNVEG